MRRSGRFAASVVVTLAAVPACEQRQPERPTSQVVHRSDGSCWKTYSDNCPEGASCNPPPPEEVDCETGAKVQPILTNPPNIDLSDSGGGAVESVEAEGGAEAVDAGSNAKTSGLLGGPDIQRRPDGSCWRVVHVDCPPGVSCNPPPPKRVPCPPAK